MRRKRRLVSKRAGRSRKAGQSVARARSALNILNTAMDQVEQAQRTLARLQTGEGTDARRGLDAVMEDLESARKFWDQKLRIAAEPERPGSSRWG